MYKLDQEVHFIGIGGVGMAGIAEVLLTLGYKVSGSDLTQNQLTERLTSYGARIVYGHAEENLSPQAGVVVVSSAVPPHNPELRAANKRGITVIPRAEMLAELMRMKYGVAIAGSHGKTTTTSMCGRVLSELGFDPTIIVGGRLLTHASGASLGAGKYLVAEADESDGSFCLLRPAISVVTNVDREHMSHYGSFDALKQAFQSFMSSVPFYGVVIACGDDPVTVGLLDGLRRRVITFGLGDGNDLTAVDVELCGPLSRFTLRVSGNDIARVALPLSGAHMVSNSLASVAVALELGASPEAACRALEQFPGVSRRTEVVASIGGVMVIDDYGHHPTEIAATLRALRSGWLPYHAERCRLGALGRLIVVFEPHRYTRTKELFEEFTTVFTDADILYLGEIYPAGETPIDGITGESLAAAIRHDALHFRPVLSEAVEELAALVRPGDIVVTLGAGAVSKEARRLAASLKD